MRLNKKKGFTLIELLVVCAIMAIIVAVTVPIVINQIDKSQEKSDLANLDNLGQNTFVCITQLNNKGIKVKMTDLLTNVYDVYQGQYDASVPTASITSTAPHLILPRAMSGGFPIDNKPFYTVCFIEVYNGTGDAEPGAFAGYGFEVAYYNGTDVAPTAARRFMVKGLMVANGQGDNLVKLYKGAVGFNDPIVKKDIPAVVPPNPTT